MPKTGTFARADSPRVPVSHEVVSRPRSAALGSVLTIWPSIEGVGCASRAPFSSVTTMNSARVRSRMAVAVRWMTPPARSLADPGSSSALIRCTSPRISGADATVRAIARAVSSAFRRFSRVASTP
jgi:hypothetical protein